MLGCGCSVVSVVLWGIEEPQHALARQLEKVEISTTFQGPGWVGNSDE
jgi:hypothetical protein